MKRKITFFIIGLFLFAGIGISHAQIVKFDFEAGLQGWGKNGGTSMTHVDNPSVDGVNGSSKVAQLIRADWWGYYVNWWVDPALSYAGYNTIEILVYASVSSTFQVKFEGGSGFPNITMDATEATPVNQWVKLTFKIPNGTANTKYRNMIVNPGANGTFFIDNITFTNQPDAPLVKYDFEAGLQGWGKNGGTSMTHVDNPSVDGVNGSSKVAQLIRADWWGYYVNWWVDPALSYLGYDIIEMLVNASVPSTFQVKFEGGSGFPNITMNATEATPVTNQWVKLTFEIPNGTANAKYRNMIVNPGANGTFYIDDITFTHHSLIIVPPTISLSVASLAFYYQTGTGPSSGKTVSVTGEDLVGDIFVAPPANYEISSNGITYQSTPITLNQNAGSYGPTNLYVRLKSGLVVGTYNGNLTFTTANTTTKTVALSGSVANALPPPDLRINEIFAEPTQPTSPGLQGALYSTIPGDANNDGLVDPLHDQFIEIYNNTAATVNVTGYKLLVDGVVKHVFPFGSTIPSNAVVVVFGGGSPIGFVSGIAHVASSGSLDLSATTGTVTFTTGTNVEIATYDYTFTSHGESLTRDPEGTGTFVLHTVASTSDGAAYSPGAYNNGAFYSPIPPVPFSWKWVAALFLLMATFIVIRKMRFI